MKTLTLGAACVLGCTALMLGDAAAKSGQRGSAMKGRTKQGRTIRLALAHHSVQLKHFSIQLRCHDGSILIDTESGFLPTPLKAGGRLRDHQVGNTDDVWLRGRMHGRVLRGSVRVRDRVGKVRCDSRWVPFHAASRGS
ncbi:MAG TPA: hypothetical protein VFK14_05745 [Solirubrobacterales bacterium]|nr:hypothetical protein [Solirubrobacterales bacterium]